MNTEDERRRIMKRLRMTKRNESICLQGWETQILVAWIEGLTKKCVIYRERNRKLTEGKGLQEE
jgi:hypothetical protein